jgi:hypothetical protein
LRAAATRSIHRGIKHHDLPAGLQHAQRFTQGRFVVDRIVQRGIEDREIDLPLVERQPIEFGLRRRERSIIMNWTLSLLG